MRKNLEESRKSPAVWVFRRQMALRLFGSAKNPNNNILMMRRMQSLIHCLYCLQYIICMKAINCTAYIRKNYIKIIKVKNVTVVTWLNFHKKIDLLEIIQFSRVPNKQRKMRFYLFFYYRWIFQISSLWFFWLFLILSLSFRHLRKLCMVVHLEDLGDWGRRIVRSLRSTWAT